MLDNEIKLAEGLLPRSRRRQSNIFVAGSPLKRQSFLTFSLALDVQFYTPISPKGLNLAITSIDLQPPESEADHSLAASTGEETSLGSRNFTGWQGNLRADKGLFVLQRFLQVN
jgi:hypothetical protein